MHMLFFSMFDFSLGRNARMQKKDMMERLRFVATLLKMDYSLQKLIKSQIMIKS